MVVLFEDSAQDDLDALWTIDEASAAAVFVLVEELQDCPEIAVNLTRHGHHKIEDPAFEVSRFQELWHRGLNMYRLKFWDEDGGTVPYRIIYAHNPLDNCIHVLGIIPRNIEYDTRHPIVVRICADYQRLGIPAY